MKLAFALAALALQPVLVMPASGGVGLQDRVSYLDDVNSYAVCTVRNHHKSARNLILANVDNELMERKFGDIYTDAALAFVPNCKELVLNYRSIIIEPDAFRASVAEVLVDKDLSVVAAADFANVPPLAHLQPESAQAYSNEIKAAKFEKQRATIKRTYEQSVSRSWLSIYGECVVRHDAPGSWYLITSKRGSAAELKAISQIKLSLNACLVEGKSLTFDKYTLRGTLAINYYRLAMANNGSSKRSSN